MAEIDAYGTLAARHGYGESPRYRRILEFLMSPRQARMAASLPMTNADLAAQEGVAVGVVEAELEELFKKGVIFPRNFETREYYRFARTIMQLHDATESLDGLDGLYTEPEKKQLWALWWDFVHNEWDADRMPEIAAAKAPPLRILPAWKAIKDIPGVLPSESMKVIVEEAPLISVVSCSCRKRQESLGNPCRLSHDMNCIQFSRAAEYTKGRGHGRMLSKEEALALIEETEEHGLVHQWPNVAIHSTNTLCSCCDDCCVFLLPMSEAKVPWTVWYAKSRFEAQNDLETCDGCQDCIERCQFDALTMEKVQGQKKLKAIVDPVNCMGCGVCVLACEPQSLKMAIVRPPEHIPSPSRHAVPEHSHAG
ncbi:MAG: ferredoxin family protein [Chloroflexi bacterium]|nr:ferredoxin family protein [Chloroflexota bacterium]